MVNFLQRNEPKASICWTIESSGSNYPSNPVCSTCLAYFEPDWDVRPIIFTGAQHRDINHDRAQQFHRRTSGNAAKTFSVLPALELLDRMSFVIKLDPCCFIFVQQLQYQLLCGRIDSRAPVQHDLMVRQSDTPFGMVLET